MSSILFIVGVGLLSFTGYVVVRRFEGVQPLFLQSERIGYGMILGPTIVAMASLWLERLNIIHFTRSGFSIVIFLVLAGALLPFKVRTSTLFTAARGHEEGSSTVSRTQKLFIFLVVLWTSVKLIAGFYDIVSVPTYQDDAFNNWNLRGKIYYQTGQYETTIINGNNVVQDVKGVASYPPTVPLTKTLIATVVGGWKEWAVNGIHVIWIAGLILAFFGTLRRTLSLERSLLWTCVLLSLPLLFIHAWVPYADLVVAGHLFLVIASLVRLSEVKEWTEMSAAHHWLLLGCTWGLLLFTKNEATVLMSPAIAILASIVLFQQHRRGHLTVRMICTGVAIFGLLALPWILYKWTHGMTFGNAKSVAGHSILFSPLAFDSIVWQITHEANFSILPLAIIMLMIRDRQHLLMLPDSLILGCFLMISTLQICIFTFIPALHNEAILQTGLNRGLLQIAPLGIWWIARRVEQ